MITSVKCLVNDESPDYHIALSIVHLPNQIVKIATHEVADQIPNAFLIFAQSPSRVIYHGFLIRSRDQLTRLELLVHHTCQGPSLQSS